MVLIRAVLILLGSIPLSWAVLCFPVFLSMLSAKNISSRILAGERFNPVVLEQVLASLKTGPSAIQESGLLRAKALIQLRLADEAGRNSSEQENWSSDLASRDVEGSLVYNSADSFLWLMHYAVVLNLQGYDEKLLTYLGESYRTGPLEGWIALRRNKIALATFVALKEDVQERVVAEFAGMVRSGFIDVASANLIGVGWEHRHRLLASLVAVPLSAREAFARKLRQEGVKADVPAVKFEEMLWR